MIAVRVPATSANLGPGFDTFGLALTLYDEVSVEHANAGLRIEVSGEGAEDVPRDERHLVVRAMRHTFDRLGWQPSGLVVTCRNAIPHARGLGSSAAAIVAGVVAARVLSGRMVDALGAAVELEGHPDNVAACLYGGLTLAVADRVVPLTVAEGLAPVVLIPPYAASTAQARRLLPATVPHSDAAANSARAALLVEALRTGDPELLLIATEDRLHQTYRAPAMPETANLVSKLRADGLPAVVSGAGPTVLCFGEPSVPPDGWRLLRLEIDRRGAVVQE